MGRSKREGVRRWAVANASASVVLSLAVAVSTLLLVTTPGADAVAPSFGRASLTTRAVTVLTHSDEHAVAGRYQQHHYTLGLLTAYANQPLYVHIPVPAPAATPAAAGSAPTTGAAATKPRAAGMDAAWEDLWPISDLRAEQEHVRHSNGHAPVTSEHSADPHHNLLLSLAELQCDNTDTGASRSARIRYPFAPFRAAPAAAAPFFPFDIAHAAPQHTAFGALPVPLPQSTWLSLLTQLPEPGLESVFDIDLGSNNLYSALFVLSYERHNSSTAAAADIRRVQFGPSLESLRRCALVFNPTSPERSFIAPTATAAATGAAAPAMIYNLSNFAGQRIAPNTRVDLATATIHHIRSPTHLFALHDDALPPHHDTTTTTTATATAAAATNTATAEEAEESAEWAVPAAEESFLPEQFIRSRPDAEHANGDTVLLETSTLDRRKKAAECSASIEEQRAVFIETGTSQLAGILSPVLSAMAAPFIDEFNDLVTSWTMLDLEENFVHGMLGGIPPLVAEPLTWILKRNITNLLSDSVTHGVTQRLAPTVANYISPLLTAMIADDVVPNVARGVHRAISDTIPHRLQYSIPKALGRSIPVVTMYRTIMGVTHSLVPALTRILSHTSNSERFCYYCQHYQQHCSDCHYININSFNIQFYSAFYSDYYGAYYADYYGQATKDLQYKLHDNHGEPHEEEDTETTKINPPPPE